jgi:hypothetical protein
MVAVRGDLYAVEPNHGEIDRINPSIGKISRLIDISASQGHIVQTALAYKGNFFVGNLGTFPVTPGTESLFKVPGRPDQDVGDGSDDGARPGGRTTPSALRA